MKNLFDEAPYQELIGRINSLTADSPRRWGKMDVAQMLAHLNEALKIPLSTTPYPRMFIGRMLGPLMKHKLYNDEVWKQGLPTASYFVIANQRQFENEKMNLLTQVNQFHFHGKETAGKFPHPFFGAFTQEQWGKSTYKHIDHHLRQFGA